MAAATAKLPQNWRDAASRLCDAARATGSVEDAVMVRKCVGAFRPPGPVRLSNTAVILAPAPRPQAPDAEFLALVAECRELAALENPMWMREVDRQVKWNDIESLRKCLRGLREMASLRPRAAHHPPGK